MSYEIIVVDDGSTDATEDVVREARRCTSHPVAYIRENGIGIAAARNAAVRHARGEWLAFTDDDQITEPAWLTNLLRAQKQTGADVVGGARRLELPDHVLDQIPTRIRLILGEIAPDGAVRECSRNDLVCTGNLLVRKGVVDELGGFDAALTQGGEDTDLLMRLRRAGYACWFTPHAIVRHIIPQYRLEPAYLLWASLRGGDCYAHRDVREWGLPWTWLVCVLRIAHTATNHVPALIIALLLRRSHEVLSRRCSLWRTWGYANRVLRMSIPRFPQRASSTSPIDFRNERKLFNG